MSGCRRGAPAMGCFRRRTRWINRYLGLSCLRLRSRVAVDPVVIRRDLGLLSHGRLRKKSVVSRRALDQCGQATKGTWGMSWRQKAMKDVEVCEKLGGVDKRALIPRSPN